MDPTRTDVTPWLIADRPTHLREWDSGMVHELPSQSLPVDRNYTIGAAEDCALRLRDPTGRVSRHHARLASDTEGRWVISDLRSKNGIALDGGPQVRVTLTPGVEIGIGGITLVVESPELRRLRDLLGRFVGWSDERRLNLAVRSARMAATRRESLQLCGDDDPTLVAIARLLHGRTLGTDRPFAICARRPSDADPQRWAHYDGAPHHGGVPRYENGLEALAAVSGGTLCVGRQKPRDFVHILDAHRDPSARFQLIVCARTMQRDPLIAPIAVAPLAERPHELDRIIDGYAHDVGAPGKALTPADRAWIRSDESRTLAQLETATVRLALVRVHGLTEAAEVLHMSHGSLSEWFARRSIDIDDGGR
jgi:hypothetical protein